MNRFLAFGICALGAGLLASRITARAPELDPSRPRIVTYAVPPGEAGVPYLARLKCAGCVGATSWEVAGGVLPRGLSASNGRLQGTPSESGSFSFALRVTDSRALASTAVSYTLVLAPAAAPLVIEAPATAGASLGIPFSMTIAASGGRGARHWELVDGALPGGLASAAAESFSIFGTATESGSFRIVLELRDDSPHLGRANLELIVHPAPRIVAATPPPALLDAPYSTTITAIGSRPPFTWSLAAGVLPLGLALNSNGGPELMIEGTPTSAGVHTFDLTITDAAGAHATLTVSITVLGPLELVSTELSPTELCPGFVVREIEIAGGLPPHSFAISDGALPRGMTIDAAGIIQGTPAETGRFRFTVTVTDALGASVSRPFELWVRGKNVVLNGRFNGDAEYGIYAADLCGDTPAAPVRISPPNYIGNFGLTISGDRTMATFVIGGFHDRMYVAEVRTSTPAWWRDVTSRLYVRDPFFAPDSKSLAFSGGDNIQSEIFWVDLSNPRSPAATRRISPASGSGRSYDGSMRWMENSRGLIFSWRDPMGTATYFVDPLGAPVRTSWNISLYSTLRSAGSLLLFRGCGVSSCLASVAGGVPGAGTPLVASSGYWDPNDRAFSPDGSMLAHMLNGALHSRALGGSVPGAPVSLAYGVNAGVKWPRADRLLYIAGTGTGAQVYAIDPTAPAPAASSISGPPPAGGAFRRETWSVSPGGALAQYYVEYSHVSGRFAYVADTSGTAPWSPLLLSSAAAYALSWSPDGNMLAYQTEAGLFVMSFTGPHARIPKPVTWSSFPGADLIELLWAEDSSGLIVLGEMNPLDPPDYRYSQSWWVPLTSLDPAVPTTPHRIGTAAEHCSAIR